jgi:hypothetical protein
VDDRARDITTAAGALIVVIYLVTSFEIGERYPFARFRMFQDLPGASSRVIAREPSGDVHEIARYVDWHCPAVDEVRFDGPDQPCPMAGSYPELDQRMAGWVRDHSADGDTPGNSVDIVRRTYFFPDRWGPAEHHDCVLLTCRARTDD